MGRALSVVFFLALQIEVRMRTVRFPGGDEGDMHSPYLNRSFQIFAENPHKHNPHRHNYYVWFRTCAFTSNKYNYRNPRTRKYTRRFEQILRVFGVAKKSYFPTVRRALFYPKHRLIVVVLPFWEWSNCSRALLCVFSRYLWRVACAHGFSVLACSISMCGNAVQVRRVAYFCRTHG